MALATAGEVVERASDLGLLDERQVEDVWTSLGARSVAVDDVVQLLVRREYLTNYQVDRLVKGDRSGFFYGPYKALYLMGTGSFARVFRAAHRETGEVVAVKVLRSRFCEDPAQAEQFLREGRVGVSLRHPNIVRTYDVVSKGKMNFLVMEFVEGWNLRDFVKIRKKVDPLQATRLVIDMAQGLNYACERGLAHRDLKLNNVLITSAGVAKLVDFGLASAAETSGDPLGESNTRTVDYAALERATGVRRDDTRSDIYFLGCMFYHMLAGQAPLMETKDRLQRMSKSRFLEVVPIQQADPAIPHCVTRIVNKAMALEPARRYQSFAAMLTDLCAAEALLTQGVPSGNGSGAVEPPEESPANQKQHSVMVVESDQRMQDIFRDGLKRVGYRVLLTSDPARAVSRFYQDSSAADCVILNAQGLGQGAVKMFNTLAEDQRTSFVPAVLLLDETQKQWQDEVKRTNRHIVLSMPITMKRLREVLASLLEPVAQA